MQTSMRKNYGLPCLAAHFCAAFFPSWCMLQGAQVARQKLLLSTSFVTGFTRREKALRWLGTVMLAAILQ